ncbi:MAG: hypothetical protein ABIE70_04985 [bacterium]
MKAVLTGAIVFLLAMMVTGCSDDGPPDPKKTVIAVFGAMDNNDQAALTYHLDLPELMKSFNEDYALQTDSPRVIHNPQEILNDLTDDGQTKRVWFGMQRIIGKAEITGESTATVEVTFVDKARSKGYLTRFGLHMVNGRWKVYSFKTITGR